MFQSLEKEKLHLIIFFFFFKNLKFPETFSIKVTNLMTSSRNTVYIYLMHASRSGLTAELLLRAGFRVLWQHFWIKSELANFDDKKFELNVSISMNSGAL